MQKADQSLFCRLLTGISGTRRQYTPYNFGPAELLQSSSRDMRYWYRYQGRRRATEKLENVGGKAGIKAEAVQVDQHELTKLLCFHHVPM